MKNANLVLIKKIVCIVLYIVIVLIIISGLGMTYFRTVEYLTLGFLQKNIAFKIHEILFPVFLLLLIIHTIIPTLLKRKKDN
ncbi:MAG: hypothetical protein CIT01_10535 [Methanobacterium sp. BRmetb2]|jgi:thiosulfate reductase cytochrome b subunit|nr:MAG: hypothetical protein CIT01_10535 [Methanobacterium sp. BRmetb2]